MYNLNINEHISKCSCMDIRKIRLCSTCKFYIFSNDSILLMQIFIDNIHITSLNEK